MTSKKILVCSVVLCAPFGRGVALADSPANTAAGAAYEGSAQNGAVELEEVVVTAQKRSERLLSVAAPVTALTSAALDRVQAVRLDDYAALTPGLNLFGTREGDNQLVVRGITTGSSLSGFDRRDPGYIDNPNLGQRNVNSTRVDGGRAALLWRPSAAQLLCARAPALAV